MDHDWLTPLIEQSIQETIDYHEKAFLQELEKLLHQQEIRIELKQGELDGKLWNPSEW
ncbi:hypothetical protein I6I78_10400 [Enterococcus casseliflavus]|uniref:hypothetical protein n=1 Tax=Enterococcus casseliflavus TaxID=37734 RepID=UPI00191AD534|nr:hypothetical protein [Enterococcus casseliflavus]QQU18656.1 hypothetical protein I6I78_10400 [Enterococcus casseliflavus]